MANDVELQRTLNEVESYLDTLSNDERKLSEKLIFRENKSIYRGVRATKYVANI